MKKFACLLILSTLLLSFSGCVDAESSVTDKDSASNEIASYIPQHPGFMSIEHPHFTDIEIYEETDYSNIVAFSDVNTYTADNAVVEYSIKNNNKNTGFWYFDRSNVEFYDGAEWITLPYKGNGAENELGWLFCCAVNEEGFVEYNRRKDLNKTVATEIVPGDYRMVSFLADRNLYFYFEIV